MAFWVLMGLVVGAILGGIGGGLVSAVVVRRTRRRARRADRTGERPFAIVFNHATAGAVLWRTGAAFDAGANNATGCIGISRCHGARPVATRVDRCQARADRSAYRISWHLRDPT